jgi:hypothetical protein
VNSPSVNSLGYMQIKELCLGFFGKLFPLIKCSSVSYGRSADYLSEMISIFLEKFCNSDGFAMTLFDFLC